MITEVERALRPGSDLPRHNGSVPGEELAGGAVVGEHRQLNGARRALGRTSVAGGGARIEVGRPEAGRERVQFGHIAVARLRSAADRYPRDEPLARLLAELRAGSEEFVEVWDTNPVRAPGHRRRP
jgi:hypothetical protein